MALEKLQCLGLEACEVARRADPPELNLRLRAEFVLEVGVDLVALLPLDQLHQ